VNALTPPDVEARTDARRPEPRPVRRGRVARFASKRLAGIGGWVFLLPALVMYAVFVLKPLATSVQYSFYDWDGVGVARPVGWNNYLRVLTDPNLVASILHSFVLIIFFTVIPIFLGLILASLVRRVMGTFGAVARTVLFLPQILPMAAAGLAWKWMYSQNGAINQILSAVGLGGITRPWLSDFDTALPAVGFIGSWAVTGFCIVLLMIGMNNIDPSMYEAARIDGAGPVREFFSITLPSVKREIGVCVTLTVIGALQTFDMIYITTLGGPGYQTSVPGVLIYQLAFTKNQVGLASALGIVLMVLVLAVILPLQRLNRRDS
jgi:raffinose/stachyose/melibiose transport system permease protein